MYKIRCLAIVFFLSAQLLAAVDCNLIFEDTIIKRWHLTKFLIDKKVLSRMDILRYSPNNNVTKLILKVNPNFFQDHKYGDALSYTNILKEHYIKSHVPKEDWILPGVIYKNKSKSKSIFVTYDSLENFTVPKGYSLNNGLMYTEDFLEAISHGVHPLDLKSLEWESTHDMLFLHHDIGHLAGYLQTDYLKAVKKIGDYITNRLKNGSLTLNKGTEEHSGLSDFLEDYYSFKGRDQKIFMGKLREFKLDGIINDYQASMNQLNTHKVSGYEKYSISSRMTGYQEEKSSIERSLIEQLKHKLTSQAHVERLVEELYLFYKNKRISMGGGEADMLTIISHRYKKSPEISDLLRLRTKLNRVHTLEHGDTYTIANMIIKVLDTRSSVQVADDVIGNIEYNSDFLSR